MGHDDEKHLFNAIAPVYGLFYGRQKKRYAEVVRHASTFLNLSSFHTVVDFGCGTGALCSVLHGLGLSVTGVDTSVRMLSIAKKKPGNREIHFVLGSVLDPLPFEDNAFDIAITSYVAHGLNPDERKRMYAQMSRLARHWVVIHDYNDRLSFLTSFIEWLERGDYFHFIKHAGPEMRDCVSEMKHCFEDVRMINVGVRAAWYICKPAGSPSHAGPGDHP